MFYSLSHGLTPVEGPLPAAPYAACLTTQAWPDFAAGQGLPPLPCAPEAIAFCKAEPISNCLLGTLALPPRGPKRPAVRFFFCLGGQGLCLADDGGHVQAAMQALASALPGQRLSPAALLLALFSQLIEGDLLFLQGLEDRLSALEDEVEGLRQDAAGQLRRLRRTAARLERCYAQLADLAQVLDESELYDKAGFSGFQAFAARCLRLRELALSLRELCTQLREERQALLAQRQTQAVNTLTVVTTVFLPLSFLTSWYGMNFSHMPELGWRFGYPLVCLLAAGIALGCFLLFKRKRYF